MTHHGDEAAPHDAAAHEAPTLFAPAVPGGAPTAARLVELRTGRELPVPASGVAIGRDPACGVVLTGPGVSRRHAVIRPGPGGYTLIDQSANGTLVNGARSGAAHPLAPGDVLRIGAEDFCFAVDGAAPAGPRAADATEVVAALAHPASHPVPPHPRAPLPASSHPRRRPGASRAYLEVTSGPQAGLVYDIERLVLSIGRGDHNDLCLADHSVSAAHATLLSKGNVWHVVDLGSANGTYVDGYRVAGERALVPGCTLRVGNVKLTFRPRPAGDACDAPDASAGGTRRVAGLFARLSRMLEA